MPIKYYQMIIII